MIHGLITAGISLGMLGGGTSAPENPSWMSWWPTPMGRFWLLCPLGLEPSIISRLFTILWVVGGICFLVSGVGIFIGQEWWRTFAIVRAALSVVVLVVYLHPWYWFALALNAGSWQHCGGHTGPPASMVSSWGTKRLHAPRRACRPALPP